MRNNQNGKRLQHYRTAILTLIVVVVLAAGGAPVVVTSLVQQSVNEAQLEITCENARTNIAQLHALQSIADRLGLPRDIEVSPLPEECME
jgi:hypothetical protein